MRFIIVFPGLILLLSTVSFSQSTRYLVRFRDKGGNPFSLSDPSTFLSQRAIDRRNRHQVAIDSLDLPVTPRYLDSIRSVPNVTVLNVSKWLNQVSILTNDANAIAKINTFPFVLNANPIAARTRSNRQRNPEDIEGPATINGRLAADSLDYGSSGPQVTIHHGNFLHNLGLQGTGMIVGMLDGGFQNYASLKAFDSARLSGRILDTWDFVANETDVQNDIAHGMECASTIAANIPGQFVGTAPEAGFFFYRTEDAFSEYPIEEHNWVCGAERIDSAGGDVISSSVGYYDFDDAAFNHVYATEFDGKTTIAARGAVVAARKGILVFNSAGNAGNNPWHFIATPADADSIIAVGAVSKDSVVGNFSSYGPSADGRVKPDLASVGVSAVIQLPGNTIGSSNGTSFAGPNLAGLGTCLWQAFPEFNNIRIIQAMKQSGHKFNSPDDRVGYGIPDMKKAFLILVEAYATANASISNCVSSIQWSSKDAGGMQYEIERQLPGESSFTSIASLQAKAGNVLDTSRYQYFDTLTNAQAGNLQYRIRQVIDTSVAGFSAGYIDTIQVNLGASCIATGIDPVNGDNGDILLMPNPGAGMTTLRVRTPYPVSKLLIRISDMKGSTLLLLQRSKPAGTSYFTLPTQSFPQGKYVITLFDDQKLMGAREWIRL